MIDLETLEITESITVPPLFGFDERYGYFVLDENIMESAVGPFGDINECEWYLCRLMGIMICQVEDVWEHW